MIWWGGVEKIKKKKFESPSPGKYVRGNPVSCWTHFSLSVNLVNVLVSCIMMIVK